MLLSGNILSTLFSKSEVISYMNQLKTTVFVIGSKGLFTIKTISFPY